MRDRSRATLVGAVGGFLVGYSAGLFYLARVRRARQRAQALRKPLDPDGHVGSGDDELTLVVLGDSSAAGDGLEDVEDTLGRQLGRRLSTAMGRPVRIRSLAASGARSIDVVEQQVPALSSLDAAAVAIIVGVNDALARHLPARVESDTGRLLRAVRHAAPRARIALLACPNLRRAPALPPGVGVLVHVATTLTARAQIRAARRAGVACVSLPEPPVPRYFTPDGFHPGPEAVGVIADELGAALLNGAAGRP